MRLSSFQVVIVVVMGYRRATGVAANLTSLLSPRGELRNDTA
jgi:hypothetical protein